MVFTIFAFISTSSFCGFLSQLLSEFDHTLAGHTKFCCRITDWYELLHSAHSCSEWWCLSCWLILGFLSKFGLKRRSRGTGSYSLASFMHEESRSGIQISFEYAKQICIIFYDHCTANTYLILTNFMMLMGIPATSQILCLF